jgi:competence protein ComEA
MLLILSYPHFYDYFLPDPPTPDFTELSRQIEQLEQMNNSQSIHASTTVNTSPEPLPIASLRPFNPNLISPEECEHMGLPANIISNLVNYRNAGGKFTYREDIKKLYHMNDEIYASISEFIILPVRSARYADTISALKTSARTVHNHNATPTNNNLVLAINTADTLQWQQLRGIGPVFSKRIVSYRNLLGGFYCIEQLREVYGLDSATYNKLCNHIILDTIELKQININTADFATLLRHPYLSQNQVTSIVNMRRVHGPFITVDGIRESHVISDSDFARVAPYLKVED